MRVPWMNLSVTPKWTRLNVLYEKTVRTPNSKDRNEKGCQGVEQENTLSPQVHRTI